jgi:hypothetical protein
MFRHPAFANFILIWAGLTAGNYVRAQTPPPTLTPGAAAPANSTSKPDPTAIQCAITQYGKWVRAQNQPVDPQLKSTKLEEINKTCGSTLHLSAAAEPPSNAQTPTQTAAPTVPDLSAVVRPLLEDLKKPEFFESRFALAYESLRRSVEESYAI